MSITQISDDMWQRQDPAAARLPRRARDRLLWSALAVLIVVVTLPVALRAGAFQPQIQATYPGWAGNFVYPDGTRAWTTAGHRVSADVSGTVTLANEGWPTLRVLDITVTGAGFRLDHAAVIDNHISSDTVHPTITPHTPATLPPGATLTITLFFTITDCQAVSAGPQIAMIHVDSWRGNQTAPVVLPTVRHTRGGWMVTSPTDPRGISSVRYLADAACGIGTPPS